MLRVVLQHIGLPAPFVRAATPARLSLTDLSGATWVVGSPASRGSFVRFNHDASVAQIPKCHGGGVFPGLADEDRSAHITDQTQWALPGGRAGRVGKMAQSVYAARTARRGFFSLLGESLYAARWRAPLRRARQHLVNDSVDGQLITGNACGPTVNYEKLKHVAIGWNNCPAHVWKKQVFADYRIGRCVIRCIR